MKLSEPRQAYVQILKQLSGQVLMWEQAQNTLEKRFKSKAKRPMTLLLVDEVNLICVLTQALYFLHYCWMFSLFFFIFIISIILFYFICIL